MMNYYFYIRDELKYIIKIENDVKYFIPPDPANTDYKQYLEWVAEGNVAEEWSAE